MNFSFVYLRYLLAFVYFITQPLFAEKRPAYKKQNKRRGRIGFNSSEVNLYSLSHIPCLC